MKHPMKIDAPATPSTKAHKETGSIPARLTLIPEPQHDRFAMNPFMKRFKQATREDPEKYLPVHQPRIVNRGPVGGANTKGQSQH